MARKINWLNHLKKFFGFERKTKQEKRNRRRGWLLHRFKSKCVPALPSRSPQKLITLKEAEDEQTKHAVAVAVATAAAAEAAVAAAQAAAQVVRLTGTPLSHQKSQVTTATIKIQAAFRGYLARRALKALKGLVKLQALVRGQSVRRQTNITLRNLQSLMKIQSQARASRIRTVEGRQACQSKDNVLFKNNGNVKTTRKQNCERWDSSSFSKEEIDAIIRSRVEAALKRERAMQYACRQGRKNSQRPNTPVAEELESEIMNHRWSWLEQWVGLQPCERDIHEILPVPNPDPNSTVHRVSDFRQREKAEMTQLRSLARRSFNRSRRASLRDDESCMSSPPLPSYMASTASTKSKFRSMSTPRQRLGVADTYSEHCFSYNNRLLSPITSIASDAGLSKIGKFPTNYQKSPRIKGQSPPVKSHRSSKYLSFDSECSLLN